MWFVYLIQGQRGSLYTGITTDPKRRFQEHSARGSRRGARFFHSEKARAMVYLEAALDRSAASKREAEIKRMRRSAKLQLVAAFQAAFASKARNLAWRSAKMVKQPG
ncbi:MAG: GIY-YIG nuclease family protein [Leptospiraceae bacterium]|nr:GIY-YIG nuclease family protein [Leptospiraceae bacterium]